VGDFGFPRMKKAAACREEGMGDKEACLLFRAKCSSYPLLGYYGVLFLFSLITIGVLLLDLVLYQGATIFI